MIKLNVCANCVNLKFIKLMEDFTTYACDITDLVIPFYARREGDKILVTFWRIPESCPLPDTEVNKRADKAPESEWITL